MEFIYLPTFSTSDLLNAEYLVGYILYFYIYSTFEGRAVFVEDVYVSKDYRQKGLGTQLWRSVAKVTIRLQHYYFLSCPVCKRCLNFRKQQQKAAREWTSQF